MTRYDDWRLASPPEADEEWADVECREVDDDEVECGWSGRTIVQIAGNLMTWTCQQCDGEITEPATEED